MLWAFMRTFNYAYLLVALFNIYFGLFGHSSSPFMRIVNLAMGGCMVYLFFVNEERYNEMEKLMEDHNHEEH